MHTPHVAGAASFTPHKTGPLKTAAWIADFAIYLAIFFIIHRLLRLTPVPSLSWVPGVAGVGCLLWAGQKLFFGLTLGQRIWKLKADRPGWGAILLRPVQLEPSERATAIFMTLAMIGACSSAVGDAILRQPLWAEASDLELEAFLPDMKSGQWEILPFYFTLGAWPKQYQGKPVFHTLPYEKGPPTRFVGHIIAHWDAPQIQVTFEGPKTPTAPVSKGERTPRERIRTCLMGSEKSWSCLKIRESTLLRHLNEMQTRLAGKSGGTTALQMKWKIKWFTVRNPAIPPVEQAQGIYLSAQDLGRAEERYVLITENGTHQAILLDYPITASETQERLARTTFEQAIRSLRASDELAPGRAWINRQLEAVRSPQDFGQVAQAQAALIAKISVDPQTFDSYFHLGMTAVVLQQFARLEGGATAIDLAAVAKPLIQNAYRYALDVSPQDPRTAQLHDFLLESKKP